MKTLFSNKKAVALFNCTIGANNKNAIRLHIYSLIQNELVYERNFIICEDKLILEDIREVLFENNKLTLIKNNGIKIHTDYKVQEVSNNKAQIVHTKNTKSRLLSNFKIKDYLHKINQLIKVPQLNNFF